jgi:hypothetical protein
VERRDFKKFIYLKVKDLINASVDVLQKGGKLKNAAFLRFR